MSINCALSSTIDIIHKNGLSFDGIRKGDAIFVDDVDGGRESAVD